MKVLRYLGVSKKRLDWISSGKQYSYVVRPGEILQIPDSEVMKAMGAAKFEVVSDVVVQRPRKVKQLPKNQRDPLVEQTIKTEEKTKTVEEVITKTAKSDPREDPFEKYETEGIPPQALVVPEPDEEEEPEEFTEMDDEPIEEVNEEPVNEVEVIEVTESVEEKIDYCSYRKAELKELCKERGLKISGNRDDLIARNVMYDIQNND